MSYSLPSTGTGANGGLIQVGVPSALPPAGQIQIFATTTDVSTIPNMISNVAPSGVVNASSFWTGYDGYKAFNSSGPGWLGTAFPAWLSYDYNASVQIKKYSIVPWSVDNFPARTPTNWQLQGSNDGGATWTVLDTRAVLATSWVIGQPVVFNVTNPGLFKRYRINITAGGGDAYVGITALKLLTDGPVIQTQDYNGFIQKLVLSL